MLVRFSFKNFASFRDEIVFDMTAVKAYKEHEYNLIDIDTKDKYLKVAVIYGANASGKSNFVEAYRYFKSIVTESFNNEDNNKKSTLEKYYYPFEFLEGNKGNTEFDATFIIEGMEYKYGFIYNDQEIVYEWLYKKDITTGRQTKVLERNKLNITMGSSVKKSCEKYAKDIEKDVLVLSFFNRLKLRTPVFRHAFGAITSGMTLAVLFNSDDYNVELMMEWLEDYSQKDLQRLAKFLRSVDIGITDISIDKEQQQIYAHHMIDNGMEYKTKIDAESSGTKKMIVLYVLTKGAIALGMSLFIDELNVKLHPLLLKLIIDMFHKQDRNAQLIYTTHDTTFLDRKFFRRDQIWFVDKDRSGCSQMYSFAEYKVRNDASFEKEYLSGAYGGIPVISNFDMQEA